MGFWAADKHMPRSPFKGQFFDDILLFRYRLLAQHSISLIFLQVAFTVHTCSTVVIAHF
jgi:hypothetical protein